MKPLAFDINSICSSGVRNLKPYEPGKPISELQRELGVTDVIKLASNENPLGPSPKALQAIRDALAELALYPDGQAFSLRQAVARKHAVDPRCITFGDGSDQILEFLARCFLEPGRNAVISRHAFAVYAIMVQAVGAEIRWAEANPATHSSQPYGHNLEAMLAAINSGTRIVFIANPNNPTGTWLNRESLVEFIGAVPKDVLVAVDEAYFEYVDQADYPDCSGLLDQFSNLVVTRTFSKAYGLAGLRAGYSLSHPDIAGMLNRMRQPFNLNNLAQAGALAALEDHKHIRATVETNRAGMRQLETGLRELGLKWIPSICNFLTVDFGKPALPVYQALLREGLIVRPVHNYGLPNHLRISIGLPEQNARLLSALRKVLST
ncbi:MAG TPA: histidinol-phosphate transaminase [Gammaproteobacteria bacterium]|nr:histidinol-phosphate transaminase [Gammaproteobacteria bacterium]